METRNKIGFYLQGDHFPAALRDWMRELDAAGVPFFLTADTAGEALQEAQRLARHSRTGDFATPHTVVFRNLAGPAEPDYSAEPQEAATQFWATHKATLPDTFDPAMTWLAPMAISRTTEQWGDWLGAFAYDLGQRMLSDGYKLAAFGFPVATPELGLWQRDAMQRFIMLCGRHPDRLAIALEEFSRQTEDIFFRREEHIGRFFGLYGLCDRARVARPTVLISRWGWTPDRIAPTREAALADIAAASTIYGRYPEVRGAALWAIMAEDEGIGWQTRRLIRPLTAWTLAESLAVVEALPPEEGVLEGLGAANARFISDVTIPDDTRVPVGTDFTKTWRVRNSGGVAWGAGFTLRHVGGALLAANAQQPLTAAQPGETVDLSVAMKAPTEPGVVFSDWRLFDDTGQAFGDIVFVRIEAVAPPAATGVYNSAFVADVTIPDDVEVAPGAALTKTWRVRNTGTEAWGAGVVLQFVGGDSIAVGTQFPVPPTAPGAEVDLSVPVVAPHASGVYYADFRLRNPAGQAFGTLLYVRFVVPHAPGSSLTEPLSQRDARWAAQRLGGVGSPKTIGEWGCLLVVMAMTARALGKDTDPLRLQEALLANQGFIDLYLTRWDALTTVYHDVVFDGYVLSSSDLLDRINASLAQGVPVPVQVDFTSDTPYTENDQHWVLIVGRDGDDYRINDPWLLPPQEASLMERYGKAGLSLRESIIAAIFYRLVGQPQPDHDTILPQPDGRPAVGRLERGMNVNPDAPFSNPFDSDAFKGLDWARFVFKLAARPKPEERDDIAAAFAQYDPIVAAYNQRGVKCLIVLNQETVWGNAPWTGNDDWRTYGGQLAAVAGEIAARYRKFGDRVAYQIWNEGDKRNNPASVFVAPEDYAQVLSQTAATVRSAAPQAPIIFNGMATGPEETVVYVKKCREAIGGSLPVDAIGIHPYTRWATRAPFDWGQKFGTLGDAVATYERGLPGLKLWITEIGVADDNEIGPEHYAAIADYFTDVMTYMEQRHTAKVPVVMWFAWSDWMRNAGMVRRDGSPKEHLFAAFERVRNRAGSG